MKTDLSKFNNDWFKPGRGFIVLIIWYVVNAIFFNSYLLPISKIKILILRFFGARIGNGVLIKPKVNIKYPWKLIVGDNTWIGEEVWIDNLDDITIGSNCCISQGALLLSGNHNYKNDSFDLMIGKIVLEDGVWIGAKSIVTQNMICGSHSILSVNSVASKNLDSYSIYSGNPAKKIRDRNL